MGIVADWEGYVGRFRGKVGRGGGCGFDYWEDVGGTDAYMRVDFVVRRFLRAN